MLTINWNMSIALTVRAHIQPGDFTYVSDSTVRADGRGFVSSDRGCPVKPWRKNWHVEERWYPQVPIAVVYFKNNHPRTRLEDPNHGHYDAWKRERGETIEDKWTIAARSADEKVRRNHRD